MKTLFKFFYPSYFSFCQSAGCNRTYYGDLGMTNSLELLRPKDERLPFICELNFTAAGGIHGDIIQVSGGGFRLQKKNLQNITKLTI